MKPKLKSKQVKRQPCLMERTRATVGYLNSHRGASKEMERWAFLSLFHPELSDAKKLELCRKE